MRQTAVFLILAAPRAFDNAAPQEVRDYSQNAPSNLVCKNGRMLQACLPKHHGSASASSACFV
jgi:hypothetical protein